MAPCLPSITVALVAATLALSLQGCTVDVPTHDEGAWRSVTSYLVSYEFIAAGEDASTAVINSCSASNVTAAEQCSGHGWCMPWNDKHLSTYQANGLTPLSFCACDPEFADPECRTKRKSQVVAFLYSLFLGILGADQFYLGYGFLGCAKILGLCLAGLLALFGAVSVLTYGLLGGLVFWWLYDIIRIGSAPVYAMNFRVSPDLPHYTFMLAFGSFMLAVGFGAALLSAAQHRGAKRKAQMLRSQQEEKGRYTTNAASAPLWRGASGYGSGAPAGPQFVAGGVPADRAQSGYRAGAPADRPPQFVDL